MENLVKELLDVSLAGTLVDGLDVPVIMVPDGFSPFDAEIYMDDPMRCRQLRVLSSTQSLLDYITRFKVSDESTVYADDKDRRFIFLADHTKGSEMTETKPMWEVHKAIYDMAKTREWEAWRLIQRQSLSQQDFAEFIEDRVDDIVVPESTDLLEMIDNFKVVQGLEYKSAQRRATGEVSLSYKTENKTGTVEIPQEITLGISPFVKGPKYSVKVRVRYRLNEGVLRFTLKIINPDEIEDDAFEAEAEKFIAVEDLNVYFGKP